MKAARRAKLLGDRTVIAAGCASAAWFAFGGRAGAAVALLVFFAVQFPSLLHGLRPTGRQRDSRPAVAALAAAAAVIALLGGQHLGTLLVVSAAAAVTVWLWPQIRGGARRARPAARSAFARPARAGAQIKGNHHGRVDVIEEVPTGRVGRSRKRGGDGPTQIELCAKANQANRLVRTAERRHVHARWRIVSTAQPCPLHNEKRHWRLRASGRATRRS